MSSNSKQRLEMKKMLKYLKNEEAFYEKTLKNMKQELIRLKIEELSLNAGIRTEECRHYKNEINDENSDSMPSLSTHSNESNENNSSSSLDGEDYSQNSPATMSQPSPATVSQPSPAAVSQPSPAAVSQPSPAAVSQPSPAANDSVMSNMLEPLILNPHHHDDDFVEFDD